MIRSWKTKASRSSGSSMASSSKMPKMMHNLKLQMTGIPNNKLLSTDERLREIDASLSKLIRSFPDVQARVEENERAWTAVSTSVRSMGGACRVAASVPRGPDGRETRASRALQDAARKLSAAGEEMKTPRMNKGHRALRALNESVRSLRARQESALGALRNREYYSKKVAGMVAIETKRTGPTTTRDIQRRLRNEQKLAEAQADLALQTDFLERDLEAVLRQKDEVLARSMRAFVNLQISCLDQALLRPVLDKVPQVESLIDDHDGGSTCSNSVYSDKTRVETPNDTPKSVAFEDASPVSPVPGSQASRTHSSSSSDLAFQTPANSGDHSMDSDGNIH